ncbi:ubiquinol-cytochrome C chaperone family protein [Caenispirillum bisanense]|uniref:Cytochrome b pre-mRNA-processing protein 3 n=1 Tax=Caenispirillum bisanense TaxID=414052 RepID=A0A286GGY7_9PROT|nr:ubiquinol-cytochrome C chaperone family protein [Caenispirillum bisanense]SOD94264.1 cytochrome b pre-mRNA-processing protein 3 [Caenispirillum bisanense]
MIFDRFSATRRRRRRLAEEVYVRLVERARDPWFYDVAAVPDTVDGRFDMIVIHAHLLFRRMGETGAEGEALAQDIFDVMFLDMDRSLREMGVGDLSVGKHVKGMARAFYGRGGAYELGLQQGREVLRRALVENVYRQSEPSTEAIDALAHYMETQAAAMVDMPLDAMTAATGPFPPRR